MSNNKFLHEEVYRGKDYLKKLQKKLITIAGVGTLGSNLADTLARQGFNKIRVIDKDRVEAHNINTQIYGEREVGAVKADAVRTLLFRNVGIEVESFNKELTADNTKKLLGGSDLIIDAFDNRAARQLMQDASKKLNIPCLHAGLFEDYGEVVWEPKYKVPKDVAGDVCDYPLARNLAMFVVSIAAEEIVNFCLEDKPRLGNWSITLKDLAIRPY